MSGRGKTEKISVTIPGELAGEIRALIPQGEVSSFFTDALEHFLTYRKQKNALEVGFGAWEDNSHPDLKAPADSSTYVRALREAGEECLEHSDDTGPE